MEQGGSCDSTNLVIKLEIIWADVDTATYHCYVYRLLQYHPAVGAGRLYSSMVLVQFI